MKLVDNWRRLWRSFSVAAMSISLAVLNTWNLLPPELKAAIPAQAVVGIASCILILGVIGRYIEQPKVSSPPENSP